MHRLSLVIAIIITLLFNTFVVSLPAPGKPDLIEAALGEIEVGDLIYVNIPVGNFDMVDPNSHTRTGRKVKYNIDAKRLSVVLVKDTSTGSVEVAYFATFGGAVTFPANLETSMWYPMKPAEEHAGYEPLPPRLNNKAQWVSLRQKYTVTSNPVKKVPNERLTEESVNLILAAMEKEKTE
ncbi:hypothetical protein AX14_013582 [Amanita brunnescens Koide BX004]|nr:hypothetical protein AX14_013582 [Amanita brunnescens Koide BX004]